MSTEPTTTQPNNTPKTMGDKFKDTLKLFCAGAYLIVALPLILGLLAFLGFMLFFMFYLIKAMIGF